MYAIAAGLLLVGALCGAAIRLVPFVFVLMGAAVIASVSAGLRGDAEPLLSTVVALVALQVGYAGGIVLRAVLRARRSGRKGAKGVPARGAGLPSEQKHR